MLFAGGISLLLLAVFYLLIDVWNIRKGTRWMIVIGSNAIFAYVAYHLFAPSFSGYGRGISEWVKTMDWKLV